jgi:AcrR family transcriptional regulator
MKGSPVPTSSRPKAKQPEPRARLRDGARTRERILVEATRLIAERGYRHMTMKAVAQEVGVTEPAVYRHFAGKEQLLLAVFSENALRTLRPTDRDRSLPAIEGIARQVALLMRPEQSTLRRLITEMYAAAAIEPKVAELARQFVNQATDHLLAELRRAQQEGDASPALDLSHARAAIHLFMAGLAHHDILAADLVGDQEWDAFVRRMLGRLLA